MGELKYGYQSMYRERRVKKEQVSSKSTFLQERARARPKGKAEDGQTRRLDTSGAFGLRGRNQMGIKKGAPNIGEKNNLHKMGG